MGVVYLLQMGDQAASVRSADNRSLCSSLWFDIYERLFILLQFATHMEDSVATMESKAAGSIAV